MLSLQKWLTSCGCAARSARGICLVSTVGPFLCVERCAKSDRRAFSGRVTSASPRAHTSFPRPLCATRFRIPSRCSFPHSSGNQGLLLCCALPPYRQLMSREASLHRSTLGFAHEPSVLQVGTRVAVQARCSAVRAISRNTGASCADISIFKCSLALDVSVFNNPPRSPLGRPRCVLPPIGRPPAPPGRACHIGPPYRQRPRSSCEKKTAPGLPASRQGPNLDFKSMCPYPRRQSLRLLCVKVRATNKLRRLHMRPFHAHLRSKQPLSSQPLSAAHTGFMAVRQTPVLAACA